MKNEKILNLLRENARLTNADIAAALGMSEAEVAAAIEDMEARSIIKGYKCVVDEEKLSPDKVSAIIELKVTPQGGFGFEDIAETISKYPEVESVSLMSGACDLIVVVNGKTFREVSSFVAKELAVIDTVTSTATQFVMRRYKEFGVELVNLDRDERAKISL